MLMTRLNGVIILSLDVFGSRGMEFTNSFVLPVSLADLLLLEYQKHPPSETLYPPAAPPMKDQERAEM